MIEQFQGEFRWLSNFAPVTIKLNGLVFKSVEHAYMSAKSDDLQWKYKCASGVFTPGQIKRLSRSIKLVDNWDTLKFEIMEDCINQKFNQEPFKSKLIATGSKHIQEGNNWNDRIWGVCLKTNKGDNILGKLIMQVRTKLLEDSSNVN